MTNVSTTPSINSQNLHGTLRDILMRLLNTMALCVEDSHQQYQLAECVKKLQNASNLTATPMDTQTASIFTNQALVKDMRLAKDVARCIDWLPWSLLDEQMSSGGAEMPLERVFNLPNDYAGFNYLDSEQMLKLNAQSNARLYFILSGTAQWQVGADMPAEVISAGNVVSLPSASALRIEANVTPLFVFYISW